ncbi:YgjP-like metallopeptidase domain-containing protein [Amycolatopsis sp. TRM77291]
MIGPDAFRAALAALDLPPEWQVEVAIRPRRHNSAIEIKPGGAVAILISPTADPEQLAAFVSSRRRSIADKVHTAMRLAPDFAVKEFVDGEKFDLLGHRYRLQLVAAPPVEFDQLPAITSDGVLYARKQRPELVRRAVIGLYREVGWRGRAAWAANTRWTVGSPASPTPCATSAGAAGASTPGRPSTPRRCTGPCSVCRSG